MFYLTDLKLKICFVIIHLPVEDLTINHCKGEEKDKQEYLFYIKCNKKKIGNANS